METASSTSLLLDLTALATLLPAALVRWRRDDARDAVFFGALALAAVGPLAWAAAQLGGAWHAGFAMSLWITIAATMVLFLVLAAITPHAWRLTALLLPYLLLLGILATIWQDAPEAPIPQNLPAGWLDAHIGFAIATYGLLTLAAVASAAVLLQERALKLKRPSALTRRLPAVADGERLEIRLLYAAETILALGVLSGIATQYLSGAGGLALDNKTLFSVAAFAVIAMLLLARRTTGLRGQRAARWALIAYLLLTLAYPGIKFVTDVILGGAPIA
ncbi:MAG TPA: cytochrome c biogenesis protein CcsA [Stellaceae bacterium]|nr:cytochrome c biogenesis protein CcsA [Stellaceae bacterium]